MRSHNFIDLTGQRFGLLTVKVLASTSGKTRWLCICDCGAESTKVAQHLTAGLTNSCGCLRKQRSAENMRRMSKTHGLSAHPLFSVWSGMMYRCYNTESSRFHRYGGRGIGVCERWREFGNFIADLGARPKGTTLDRIDNDSDYSPENCRWATVKQQNNNRANVRLIEFAGECLSAAVWAQRVGVSKATMYRRLENWPLERALSCGPTR
jgi:hypothetical protein